MAQSLPISQFTAASVNLVGTELLPLAITNTSNLKLTILQLQTLYPASSAIVGTESLVLTTAGNSPEKTTVSQVITQATASASVVGTELLLQSPAAGSVKKTSVSQLITQATASAAVAGTELLLQSPSAGSVNKTTVAQLVTQATAAGNPSSADLVFTTQSGNLRASSIGALTAFCPYLIGGGTANAQTVTLSPIPTSYYTGMVIVYLPLAANTGSSTINVNGLGNKNIFAYGAALVGAELQTNVPAELIYDGTQFQFINPNDSQGSFTGTLTGFTAGNTGTINWRVVKGRTAYIFISAAMTGTSNTTGMTMTGIPAAINPVTSKFVICRIEDATSSAFGGFDTGTANVWTFHNGATINTNTFTASGVKGLPGTPSQEFSFTLD